MQKIFRRLTKNPLAWLGIALLGIFLLVAIFAPLLAPVPDGTGYVLGIPERIPREGFAAQPVPPNSEHLLGTSEGQYDIYFGLVWGSRTAFLVGLLVVTIGIIVGTILGALSGYFGGVLDTIIMRFTDIVFAVPALVLAMVVVTVLGQSLTYVMAAIALVSWPTYARVMRGEVMAIKSREFVEAARALGVPVTRILSRHISPNTLIPMLVVASLDIGSVVLLAASLSFLGIGAPLGFPDWGQLVSFARNWMVGPPGEPLRYWFVSFYPGLTILLFVLGWNLLGDAVRDALDVRAG